MTRETKIGLLVGLAFIIVIGILLSNHFQATMESPQALLDDTGKTARIAVRSPGMASPQIVVVAPPEVAPSQAVPTQNELTHTAPPVVPSPNYQSPTQNQQLAVNDDNRRRVNPPVIEPMQQQEIPPALNNAARDRGEPLVPANVDGSPRPNDDMQTSNPAPAPALVSESKTYKAQPGDTVSRMAARLLGANTRANRQLIINANESLRDDPDQVIVGQAYTIPTRQPVNSDTTASNDPQQEIAPQRHEMAPPGEYFYVVQEGDSLWQIANDEMGDPATLDAIRELNAGILKGEHHDIVTPGMKIRLPAKPVASAN